MNTDSIVTRTLALAIVLGSLAVTGCGEKGLHVVPVSGKVVVQGQPAAGAQVVLHPVAAKADQTFSAIGKVQDDGSFKISAFGKDDGAPPGEYVATVQWFKVVQNDGGAGPGPNVIPRDYGDPARSPFKVTIKDEPTVLQPFEVKWR
jgi:hypothetical protein